MQPTETDELLLICCDQLDVLPQQVMIPTRGVLDVVIARQLYHYICLIDLGQSQKVVAAKTNRHHTTLINSVAVVRKMLRNKDTLYSDAYHEIMKKINQPHAI